MDRRYAERVALLVAILPHLDCEPRFALKGGTAINLFEHELPRLSVDIDLTWLPMQDFETDATQIAAALTQIAQRLSAPPLRLQVRASAGEGATTVSRLIASRGRTQVQIETTPVMRGTVHPARRMDLRPAVERQFGSAQIQVLSFADLYAGKLAAALSRQHPRDLFDVGVLLDHRGIDTALWRTFLVYLTASPKPAADMLAPNDPRDFAAVFDNQFRGMTREPVTLEWLQSAADMLAPNDPRDFAAVFDNQFRGMTREPVTLEWLLAARARLLVRIREMMDASTRDFLLSVEREAPAFELIGLPHAVEMPGVRRKLQNLARRSPEKREADYRILVETLARIAQ